MDALNAVEAKQMKEDVQPFKPGDTLRVHFKIVEGASERVQVFEGICIARKNAGLRATLPASLRRGRRSGCSSPRPT